MRKWTIRGCVAAGALFLAALTYFVGYLHGYEGYPGQSALIDAVGDISTLSAMRRGDQVSALHNLEASLDMRILQHSIYVDSQLNIGHLLDNPTAQRKLISRIAEYRKQYPSVNPHPGMKAAIAEVLEGHKDH